ncbi:MAG: arsenate reductase [Gammaproteobacteria bacterium]|nr:MAG: arsenate reductase [Gammaproteobacteria bacterium]
MITLYGIKNCDTVKKAIKQLDKQRTAYTFIDLKTADLSTELLQDWLRQCPETLVNKRSTTYRRIKADWLAADNQQAQIALIQANPTVIKRPVLVKADNHIMVGFDAMLYGQLA